MAVSLPRSVFDVVSAFHGRLAAHFAGDLLDVRVFGSYARGEANEASDIDVFVVLRVAGYPERRFVLDTSADLWLESGLLLSPTVMSQRDYEHHRRQRRPLVSAVEREGIAV